MLYGRKPIGTVAYMGGVPAVATPFCRSWGKMLAYTYEYVLEQNERIHIDEASFSFHSWARNQLVERMAGDWLLMLDTDHEFEPDILGRLLHRMNVYDLDVVCGIYQFKTPPYSPVLFSWHGEPGNEGQVPLAGWGGDIIEIGATGGGCLLVKRKVFDRIKAELNEGPFDVIGQGGEDFGFFRRLLRLGIKPYCDTRVECPHLMTRGVTLADFDREAVAGSMFEIPGNMVVGA